MGRRHPLNPIPVRPHAGDPYVYIVSQASRAKIPHYDLTRSHPDAILVLEVVMIQDGKSWNTDDVLEALLYLLGLEVKYDGTADTVYLRDRSNTTNLTTRTDVLDEKDQT